VVRLQPGLSYVAVYSRGWITVQAACRLHLGSAPSQLLAGAVRVFAATATNLAHVIFMATSSSNLLGLAHHLGPGDQLGALA
jgi:hypothetical protein